MEELTQDGAQLARTMLMAAAQLAESMARVQAQRAWIAQSKTTEEAAQACAQIAAERDAARMVFRPLADDRYWRDAPQFDRVVQAYTTAASWAEHDPEARAALQLIKQQAEERWGGEVGNQMRTPDSAHVHHDGGGRSAGAGQHPELTETLLVERVPTQASLAAAEANVARSQSAQAISRPIESSLQEARSRQAKSAPVNPAVRHYGMYSQPSSLKRSARGCVP